MKIFVFLLKQKSKASLDKTLLIAHVEHLKNLHQSGRLIICGPFTDNDNALQIITADTKEEAILLFEQDPFIKTKYYQTYSIYELLEANEKNKWLLNDP